MKHYSASTTIDAIPERVWQVLVDGGSYSEWDPYCERIEGEIAPGNRIKAFTTLSPGRAFPVKVTTFQPHRTMVWTGGMPFGLFKGERTFTLSPSADGNGTDFTVAEIFTGPLLGLFSKSLPDMTEPFRAFAEGLKKRVESKI